MAINTVTALAGCIARRLLVIQHRHAHTCMQCAHGCVCVCTCGLACAHTHTHIYEGEEGVVNLAATAIIAKHRTVGWAAFLLNETMGDQPDNSSHPCKGGRAHYILASVEPAMQLISLLCSYPVQLQNGLRNSVGCCHNPSLLF